MQPLPRPAPIAGHKVARVHVAGGRAVACTAETDEGRELFLAASRVLDAAR